MTQQHKLIIENLKCGGCTSTIIKQLSAIDEIEKVQVDAESETVSFVAPVELVSSESLVKDALVKLLDNRICQISWVYKT